MVELVAESADETSHWHKEAGPCGRKKKQTLRTSFSPPFKTASTQLKNMPVRWCWSKILQGSKNYITTFRRFSSLTACFKGAVLSRRCLVIYVCDKSIVSAAVGKGEKKKKVHQKTTPGTYLRTTPTISRPLSLASPLEPSRCTLKQLRCFLINTVVWEQFTGHFQSVKERRADKFPFEEKLDLTIEYAMNFTFCLSQIIWEERIAAHRKWCRGHTARHSPCPSESPPYMSSVHPAT